MIYLYPYIGGSQSVRQLKERMNNELRVLRRERSRFRGGPGKTVVNWGAGRAPAEVLRCRVVNNPVNVGHAANKLDAFRIMHNEADPITVEYTESQEVALRWITDGHTVVARTLLSAHEGRGIVLVTRAEELPPGCRLFTKYKKKAREFRVHVWGNHTLVNEKLKRRGGEHHPVRNTANGYVFARQPKDVPESTVAVAIKAVERLGLTFGAVDVIYNQREKRSYVLEVNTAPGIETSIADWYVTRIRELV